MCRSIQRLHNVDPPVTAEQVRAASLQFVRKIAGTTKPSRDNVAAFEQAVDEVAAACERLLAGLVAHAPPQDREAAAAKARERWQQSPR
jgi:hypothetical protein